MMYVLLQSVMMGPRDHQGRLLVLLTSDYLGNLTGDVVGGILDLGTATLGQVSSRTGLSVKVVRAGLALLVKHRLVSHETDENHSSKIFYSVISDNILAIINYPHYTSSIRSSHGELAEMILEQMIRSGTSSVTSILSEIGRQLINSEAASNDGFNLSKSLSDILKIFKTLVNQQYLLTNETRQESDVQAICTFIESENMKNNEDMEQKTRAEKLPEDTTYYYINVPKFTEIMRNKMIVDAATR